MIIHDSAADDSDSGREFEMFYVRQLVPMLVYCRYLGLSPSDAQDITQESFVRLLARWEKVGEKRAYLRKIAYHLAMRNSCREDVVDETRIGWVADTYDIAERYTVLRALRQLPGQQKAVFALSFDDFSPAQIGNILGVSTATVRSHLRHARRTLCEWWAKEIGDLNRGEGE